MEENFSKAVRVSSSHSQPSDESQVSQEWAALILLLQGTSSGKCGLGPAAKTDFKAQRETLSQFLILEQEVSLQPLPGPGQLSPHTQWPPMQDSKESKNFHSNVALQVIIKNYFQGQPTEHILSNSLLVCFIPLIY